MEWYLLAMRYWGESRDVVVVVVMVVVVIALEARVIGMMKVLQKGPPHHQEDTVGVPGACGREKEGPRKHCFSASDVRDGICEDQE